MNANEALGFLKTHCERCDSEAIVAAARRCAAAKVAMRVRHAVLTSEHGREFLDGKAAKDEWGALCFEESDAIDALISACGLNPWPESVLRSYNFDASAANTERPDHA